MTYGFVVTDDSTLGSNSGSPSAPPNTTHIPLTTMHIANARDIGFCAGSLVRSLDINGAVPPPPEIPIIPNLCQ